MPDPRFAPPGAADVVVHSARLADGGRLTPDSWVRWRDGRVVAVGTGPTWRPAARPRTDGAPTGDAGPGGAADDADAIDARAIAGDGAVLAPGFVDIHGHGGGGAAVDDGVDAIRHARRAHRRHGTTSALVSLVAAPQTELEARLELVAGLTRTDPDVLGAHLEGPFLSRSRAGAHDPAALSLPDAGAVDALLAAGPVRQLTIAPELPGAIAAIERIVAGGTAAAVGHTEADAATARRAFDAGATILTHAFNAMPGLHHRAPGPAGAALADARVTLELIADGVHVHPDLVRIALAAGGGRIALVTDAMAAAAASGHRFRLGSRAVDVRGGVARLTGTDVLAGSTLTQDAAVRAAVAAGRTVAEALHAASAVPAAAIGVAHEVGRLAPGMRADAVLLDASLAVRAVWSSGRRTV